MELGKQIKKYRMEAKLSQEELADKVFVSRQTISNWENDKNYPDINSLVLMSEVFHSMNWRWIDEKAKVCWSVYVPMDKGLDSVDIVQSIIDLNK